MGGRRKKKTRGKQTWQKNNSIELCTRRQNHKFNVKRYKRFFFLRGLKKHLSQYTHSAACHDEFNRETRLPWQWTTALVLFCWILSASVEILQWNQVENCSRPGEKRRLNFSLVISMTKFSKNFHFHFSSSFQFESVSKFMTFHGRKLFKFLP